MAGKTTTARLEREKDFRLRVHLGGDDRAPFIVDAAPPLGEAQGPDPVELLAASVGTCLSQSLLFCLRRSRADVEGLETEVEATVDRNAQGRLRVTGIRVTLSPLLAAAGEEGDGGSRVRLARCAELFQDYCTVAESLRGGIPVEVTVVEPAVR
jgi:uncharacterized OsmC-like protein